MALSQSLRAGRAKRTTIGAMNSPAVICTKLTMDRCRSAQVQSPEGRYYGSVTTSGSIRSSSPNLALDRRQGEWSAPYLEPAVKGLKWVDKYFSDSRRRWLLRIQDSLQAGRREPGVEDFGRSVGLPRRLPGGGSDRDLRGTGYRVRREAYLSEVCWWFGRRTRPNASTTRAAS